MGAMFRFHELGEARAAVRRGFDLEDRETGEEVQEKHQLGVLRSEGVVEIEEGCDGGEEGDVCWGRSWRVVPPDVERPDMGSQCLAAWRKNCPEKYLK